MSIYYLFGKSPCNGEKLSAISHKINRFRGPDPAVGISYAKQ